MEVIRTPPAVSYNDVSSRDISGTARNHRRRRAVSKQPSESPIKKVANNNTPTIKPKQSKSRNGCVTCKLKRLKCDESKPFCRQCEKRNVTCGGYKKNFKWRPFEESCFTAKISQKGQRVPPSRPALHAVGTGKNFSDSGSKTSPSSAGLLGSENLPSESQSPQPTAQPGSASKAPETQDNVCTVIGSQSFPQDKHQDSPMIITPPCPIVEQTPNFKDDVLSETQTVFTPEGFFDMEFFLSPQTNENEDVENVVRQTTNSGVESQIVWSDPVSPSMISKALFELALPTEPKFAPESSEMLLMRFDRRTCGILSVKDGISENPWRTLVWPLAKEAPSLYHAICALAAFHCSKEDPQLRVSGMDHMRRSIHTLAMDIRTMRTDTALATTLALTFAESWDRQTSNGIQHLRGAKILVSQALANQRQLSTRRSDVARLRFLYNTWIYTAVIARLTSVQEGGFDELPLPSDQSPSNRVHEIDPLLGCAATLFPLIGRVADLVQKVCSTSTNSIAVISQAIELKTLIEQWEPPKYFEPPEDPTSDIQHSFQTAQAYRWATLLHLHNAVPEIPSESAGELAKRVLVLLATVPLSSRTIVVQIFPLLAASCEIDNEEDRHWVRQRWAAMQTRLMIGNIDRCLEVIHAVWSRRDEYKFNKLNAHQAPFEVTEGFMGHGDTQDESAIDDDYSGSFSLDYFDSARRQSMSVHSSVGFSSPILSPPIPVPVRRGSMNMTLENLEFEKTVRGRLHWLGVMRDWNWEVLLG